MKWRKKNIRPQSTHRIRRRTEIYNDAVGVKELISYIKIHLVYECVILRVIKELFLNGNKPRAGLNAN